MNSISELREQDRGHVWHPYTTRSAAEEGPFPFITRGEGVYLYDTEGRRYFDAISSWWCCNLGHGHPRLVEAIVRQARELQHSILGNLSHPRAAELAGALAGLLPGRESHVLFASDGASAVEAALKVALQYWHNVGRPGRNRFAALKLGYHGDTLGAVSVGRLEAFHKPFESVLFPVFQADSPCCGTCAFGREPGSCRLECFASMEGIFQRHAGELAAVIVEPLCQGAGGMRIYSPNYLRRLADLCRREKVILIVDEIAMGFGRTGRMFAFEHAGVTPDIVCLGKGLSGGYLPISATLVRDEIFDTFGDRPEDRTFYHGHTFAGNPIAAAAAVELLRVYAEEDIVGRARQLGEALKEEMEPLRGLPHVRDVRCLGAIGVVELGDAAGGARGTAMARAVRRRLFDDGVFVRPLGPVVYLMPPLTTGRDDLARVAGLLGKAVEQSARG